jgi:hypothetical protein
MRVEPIDRLTLHSLSNSFFHMPTATLNPFNVGEMWTGTFSTIVSGVNISGGMTLEVTDINGLQVQLLATLQHGAYCNAAAGCRTPGVTAFYLNGSVNAQQLVAKPTAWSPITDTTFPAQSLSGFLSVVGNATRFSGFYGSGTFNTTLACSASLG